MSKRWLRLSDLVFAQSSTLAAHCAQWRDDVHIFPSGVNLTAFPIDAAGAADLETLPRPVIGYVGGLHRHVDVGLLAAMARERPYWSWVYVGPVQTSVNLLATLPNVYFLGQYSHPELASLISHFDVGIVPYVKSPYTDTVVPTKINEYLAMGKPVVTTMLPMVCEFNAQHQVLGIAAPEPQGFLQAIDRALELPLDAPTIARRREVAGFADWNAQLVAMSALISNVGGALRRPDRNLS